VSLKITLVSSSISFFNSGLLENYGHLAINMLTPFNTNSATLLSCYSSSGGFIDFFAFLLRSLLLLLSFLAGSAGDFYRCSVLRTLENNAK